MATAMGATRSVAVATGLPRAGGRDSAVGEPAASPAKLPVSLGECRPAPATLPAAAAAARGDDAIACAGLRGSADAEAATATRAGADADVTSVAAAASTGQCVVPTAPNK
jgi:hypothetical protein